jgi:hypothetical protein
MMLDPHATGTLDVSPIPRCRRWLVSGPEKSTSRVELRELMALFMRASYLRTLPGDPPAAFLIATVKSAPRGCRIPAAVVEQEQLISTCLAQCCLL